ncbi:hypothetical protein F5Y06DRAFT_300402 [Hypoxylon sp. FL0890]|nr:hypothetical protein F5Y06DRAFT_300402 [Hypoxylon sp. FL0890]
MDKCEDPADKQVDRQVDEKAAKQSAEDAAKSTTKPTAIEAPADYGLNVDMTQYLDKVDNLANAVNSLTGQLRKLLALYPPGIQQPVQYPAGQGANQSTAASSVYRLEREYIGLFNPEAKDLNEVGYTVSGSTLVYTEVCYFADRVESFLKHPATATSNQQLILSIFQTLLNGPAVTWWLVELTKLGRHSLRTSGVTALLTALKDRFAMDTVTATTKFTKGTLSYEEAIANENMLMLFVQKKLRYARAMNILGENYVNWYGVMQQIWWSMDWKIQWFLHAPTRETSWDCYMQQINKAARNIKHQPPPPFQLPSLRQAAAFQPAFEAPRDREDDHTDKEPANPKDNGPRRKLGFANAHGAIPAPEWPPKHEGKKK